MFETAHNTEAAANPITPPKKASLRPKRSPMRPAVSRAAAKAMLYALKTHVSWRCLVTP